MKNTLLPFHAVTGLQAIGWRKARLGETGNQPIWPIAGGAPDEDDDAADDQGDDSDNSDADDATDDDADKGEAEKDWKAEYEAQKRINRSLERKTRRDKARLEKLDKAPPAKDDDKADADPEKLRAELRAEVEAEALKGRVEDKIEAKARAFADPEDAVAVLLRQHNIDDFIDDGKIDVEAISDALTELGNKKPNLLAQGKRFQGSADGGARPSKPERPKDLGEALARHYSGK